MPRPNPPPFDPLDDDEEDFPDDPRITVQGRSRHFHGASHCRSDTGQPVYPCPACQSLHTEPRHVARRIGGAIGTVAGASGAFAGALAGAESGTVFGAIIAGPPGAVIGSLAGAILAALAGAAAGGGAGIAIGEMVDANILHNYRCRACGHVFSLDD